MNRREIFDRFLIFALLLVVISYITTELSITIAAIVLNSESEIVVYTNGWFVGLWSLIGGIHWAFSLCGSNHGNKFCHDDQIIEDSFGGNILFLSLIAFAFFILQFVLAIVAIGVGSAVSKRAEFSTGFYSAYLFYILVLVFSLVSMLRAMIVEDDV